MKVTGNKGVVEGLVDVAETKGLGELVKWVRAGGRAKRHRNFVPESFGAKDITLFNT